MRKLILGLMLVVTMSVPSFAETTTDAVAANDNAGACKMVEEALLRDINDVNVDDADGMIARAKKYALLSERGCAENSERYKELAATDLQTARAMENDKLSKSQEGAVTDTYRRLEMQQAANEIIGKVKKLTGPAIDFLIEAQKIIEE